MVGTTAIGGVRPSTDGSSKRSAGRYVLGDLLGRGGMAEVFAGHALGDHGFQKPVAIKRLLPELASDHVFVERLIEEAKLLVGMQHGNIVSVLDLARQELGYEPRYTLEAGMADWLTYLQRSPT